MLDVMMRMGKMIRRAEVEWQQSLLLLLIVVTLMIILLPNFVVKAGQSGQLIVGQLPAQAQATATPASGTYTLQKGEYPFCIARRFNVDINELLTLNNLNLNSVTLPGQVLRIPQTGRPFAGPRALHPSPATYTVKAGDSLYSIACYYGDVDPLAIAAANGLTPPYSLTPGQVLQIPGSGPTLTATTTLAAPTLTPSAPLTYTLQPGEYPYCLARRFNVDPDELLTLNGLNRYRRVTPGQVLKIPQTGRPFPGNRALRPRPATYTVRPGDNIYSIACYYGDVDPLAIAAANGLTPPYTLTSGQVLQIPGTGAPLTPSNTPTNTPTGPTPTGPTPIPSITPTPGTPATYTLQEGEYPYCIARRFNVDPTELLALNNLNPYRRVTPGQVLLMPQTGHPFPGTRALHPHPASYTVKAGDSIYTVACYYGDVDPMSIVAANNLTPPYTLTPGQILQIDGTGSSPTNTSTQSVTLSGTPSPTVEFSPTVTLTSTPSPSATTSASIIWQAGHESGDISEWEAHGGFIRKNLTDTYQVTTAQAHSGNYSVALTIDTTQASATGDYAAYLFVWDQTLLTANAYYYSAWFYLPAGVTPGEWWNIFQWKSTDGAINDPMFVLDIAQVSGTPQLRLIQSPDKAERLVYTQALASVPFGRWFHIEGYYRKAMDATGQVVIWLDGLEIFNVANVVTALADNSVHWSVNNYAAAISPNPCTIYVDDAAISTTRLGP